MNIENYAHLFDSSDISNQTKWKDILIKQLEDIFAKPSHGHFKQWLNTVEQLARFETEHCQFDKPIVEIGLPQQINKDEEIVIQQLLKTLQPWRKGPFNFFGVHIDSEWRCDKKWQRVQSVLPTLEDKKILVVGCGNGYYMLRMLGAEANKVIGVDPTLMFLAQYTALTQAISNKLDCYLLPITLEQLPTQLNQFDIVFSMGVLYHRRDPLEHLKQLYTHTIEGGKLILETLIINDSKTYQLIPEDRYAGMRNVWNIPSPSLLESWLSQCGYQNIQLQNIQTTEFEEQRATEWTKNYSLKNFLDPDDLSKTIEGYPAPTRAIFSAEKY